MPEAALTLTILPPLQKNWTYICIWRNEHCCHSHLPLICLCSSHSPMFEWYTCLYLEIFQEANPILDKPTPVDAPSSSWSNFGKKAHSEEVQRIMIKTWQNQRKYDRSYVPYPHLLYNHLIPKPCLTAYPSLLNQALLFIQLLTFQYLWENNCENSHDTCETIWVVILFHEILLCV